MQEWVLQSSSKTAICLRQHYQWGVVVLPSKCKTQILIKSKAELFPSVSFCNSHAASPEIVRIGLILIGENPLSIFFQSLSQFSCVRLFATPWTAVRQDSLSITNSWSLIGLMSIRWYHPTISCSVVPFSSHLQSCPASGSFSVIQFFASTGQSIGVSALASVLPMNGQDRSPFGWASWISLQSKGFSRVFPNTTVQKHQFFGFRLN